ncbi:MAG: hypothetical protein K0Q95_1087 [Bacteroidota bacterium]|jgi:hypothetical protein|nr:hypothetical protein [Bacteroidota bacterium]
MKMKTLLGTFICLTVILASSCRRDKDSVPHVTVVPTPLYIYGSVGDLINFNITVDSDKRLSKFYISQQPDNQVPVTVLDTAITTKGVQFVYYYRMPANMAGKSIIFEFKAEDEDGNVGKQVRRVFIAAPTAVTLTETTGHRMYSNLSANPDAYDLETNTPQASTVDTTLRDIQDNSGIDTVLSKSWISPAGGQFVKANGYDYANASDVTATSAYTGGLMLSQVSGLAVNDILITKLGGTSSDKYVVLRITNIIDQPGKNNDYYEFSIKKK